MKVKIKNVKVVYGNTLNPYWKSDMQVVTTDKGKYIDNAVDSDYKIGHDWEKEIGHSVDVKINNSKGHKWINYKGRAQNSIFNTNDSSSTFKNDIYKNQEEINHKIKQNQQAMYRKNTARYLKLKKQREREAAAKESLMGKIFIFIKNIF